MLWWVVIDCYLEQIHTHNEQGIIMPANQSAAVGGGKGRHGRRKEREKETEKGGAKLQIGVPVD
jgi:hypothetical protein